MVKITLQPTEARAEKCPISEGPKPPCISEWLDKKRVEEGVSHVELGRTNSQKSSKLAGPGAVCRCLKPLRPRTDWRRSQAASDWRRLERPSAGSLKRSRVPGGRGQADGRGQAELFGPFRSPWKGPQFIRYAMLFTWREVVTERWRI